ncbi:MAG: transposase, partial [Solirubrobacterales bacterium]|nr:transposase [Solirubrobacterales bacterium]
MNTEPLLLLHERVDDVPLLWGLMQRLGLAEVLQKHLGSHHLHQGLANGTLACVWLAYILSQADHRKNAVRDWAHSLHHTLETLTDQPLRQTDFTDDRLAIVLRRFAQADWPALEADLWQATCQVYEVPVESVRLDASTFCGYHTPHEGGLMQLGHSKDHRPDLPQLKLMAAAAQPHGHLLACDIAPGQSADDSLYLPLLRRLRLQLGTRGLLYAGDCKMAALATRADIAGAGDYYLMPLPLTGETAQQFDGWVQAALQGRQPLQRLQRPRPKGGPPQLLGWGYEFRRTLSAAVPGRTVRWQERVQVVQSASLAASQKRKLHERLRRAEQELWALTPEPGRGHRVWRDEQALAGAVEAVLTRYQASGLLRVGWQRQEQTRTRYPGPGRPGPGRVAQVEVEVRYRVSRVERDEAALREQERRLGWRVQVSNLPGKRLSLLGCVLAYREGWSLERDFHLLKDKPLGVSPLWVQTEEQILGLTRLLTVGLRLLSLVEVVSRQALAQAQEELPGLFEGQPTRRTSRPTAVRLLRAVSRLRLTLSGLPVGGQVRWHLNPLPPLLQRVLGLLGLDPSLYTHLASSPAREPHFAATAGTQELLL